MSETQISIKGRQVRVPEIQVNGLPIVVTGGWLKQAVIKDEDYVEGDPVAQPETVVAQLRARRTGADIFSFAQRTPGTARKPSFPSEPDNVAAIPVTSYNDWSKKLSQETRRNVRLAGKRGVVLREVPFTDELVRGISGIYNEVPFRHGRQFWHYGKDLETVKRENATYLERSTFIGAYCGTELIGFIKMVAVDKFASIMQILSKVQHQDKRPTNALIAKAVEICEQKGLTHLLYCKYTYHRDYDDALTEFKRRNGFEPMVFPRYYVPLTWKGNIAVRIGLHHGVKNLLPRKLLAWLLSARAKYYQRKLDGENRTSPPGNPVSAPAATFEARNAPMDPAAPLR